MSTTCGYTRNNQSEKVQKLADTDRTYIYDLGEHPVKNDNKERFRLTWSDSRPEYSGHSFKVKIDGKEHEVTVPNQVAREIHITAETEAHPLTFHQKLQPNYVSGNKNKSPAHVNNLRVQNVCYFNSIQSHLQLPNYLRQKSWAIQKEIFANNVKYKDIGKSGHPSVMDLDYSSQVLAHLKKEIQPKKKSHTRKQKANCGGSKLVNDKGKYDEVLKVLPGIDEYVLAEEEEDDDSSSSGDSMSSGEEDTAVNEMNIERKKQDKIKKKKLSKKQKKVKESRRTKGKEKEKEGVGDDTVKETTRMATRSSPSSMSVFERSMMPPPPSRTNSKSGEESKKKRRLTFTSGDGAPEDDSQPSSPVWELGIFEDANIPKKNWDNHPEMPKLIAAGTVKIDALGFESPRKGATSKESVASLCTKHNLTVPKRKAEAVKALVRTLAIQRLLSRDPSLKDEYDDNSDS